MTTPRDPYKAGRGYDHRDDFPGAKATRRRRGSNQWARKQGKRDVAERVAEAAKESGGEERK